MEDDEDDTGDNADAGDTPGGETDDTAHGTARATPGDAGEGNVARRRRFDERRAQGRANCNSMRSRHSMDGAFACLLQTTPFALISAVEVTEKADLSRNTFYHHFPTCDALLDEFLSEPTAHVMENMRALAVWMDPDEPRQFATFLVTLADQDQEMLRERFFVANGENRYMLTTRLLGEIAPVVGAGVGRWTLRGAQGEARERRMAMTRRYVETTSEMTVEIITYFLWDGEGRPVMGDAAEGRRTVVLLTGMYAAMRDAYLTE